MIRIKIRKDLEFELPIKWLPTHRKTRELLIKWQYKLKKPTSPLELKKIHNKVNVPAMSLAQCEVARMHCY